MKIECTVEEFKKLINNTLSYVTKIGIDGIEIRPANAGDLKKLDD